jgi:Ni,Fe-hydrogenase III large subunit
VPGLGDRDDSRGPHPSGRGPVVVGLTAGDDGCIRRCHPHDPSWQNWPALEYAIIGNIVPDFPLINKSFNLSYSGHDL